MIPDVYYQDYYLLIVALATLVIGLRYAHYSTLELQQTRASSVKITISFTVLIILFIGLRPQSEMFPDMMGYITSVENEWWSLEEIRWDTNYLFVPLMFFLQTMKASGEVIMLVLASIYFGALLIAMNKLFPKHRLLAMIVYCGAFMTFSNATNGMKAGCATAFFICAIAYFESKPLFALFLFLSLGFHHAAQLLVVVYMLCYVYNNYRFYLVIWLICLILAILHITYFQMLFGSWTDDHGAEYLLIEATSRDSGFGGKVGFRYDFVLYSVVPMLLGYYSVYKKNIRSKHYLFMLNVYTMTNAIWMLCMYASYTNRIAALGWGLYSILILYPVLQEQWHKKQNTIIQIAIFTHLGFTLVMHFIYYL